MKFTDKGIKSLKPTKERYIEWKANGEGLGIRVSPKGKKSFIYMYRFDGKSRMMTLGEYPKISLVNANLSHRQAAELLNNGTDPGAKKVIEKKQERNAETIEELAHEYIEKWAQPRKRSWKEDKRMLERDVIPHWSKYKARNIKKRDIIVLLDSIIKRGAPIQANRTLSLLRKMFNFAISRDIIEYSPCTGITMPAAENQRDRVLTESEIKCFWDKLEDASMHKASKLALKLQLLTAQRAGEIAGAEWSEIDLPSKWWMIPAHKAKNKLLHRVPLSSKAIKLIGQVKELSGDSKYLFPSPRGDKNIGVTALGHTLRKNNSHFNIPAFIPHDLRRTAASHMTGMGINRLVVSKILNHVESGVTAVYDRYSYDNEKQQALETWGNKVSNIIRS